MVIYNMAKALIAKGKTDGLKEKLDVFFMNGTITEEQYKELLGLMA